jgi:hypothetical protein
VARHHGIAASADGDVERRPRPAAVGEAGGEPDAFDEALGIEGAFDLMGALAPPVPIAMIFDLRGESGLLDS